MDVPLPGTCPGPIAVTQPSHGQAMEVVDEGDGRITLNNHLWERMWTGEINDTPGSERRALLDGRVGVSPLTSPHSIEHDEVLYALAKTYDS